MSETRVGTITADEDRYVAWKSADGDYSQTRAAGWSTMLAVFPPVKKMYLYTILQIAIKDFVLLLKRPLAEGFALQYGSCVLVGPAGISLAAAYLDRADALKNQEAFEVAGENAILGRDCFWRAMSGRPFNPYSSNLFHRMKVLCDELGIEVSKKAENRWSDQPFSE